MRMIMRRGMECTHVTDQIISKREQGRCESKASILCHCGSMKRYNDDSIAWL